MEYPVCNLWIKAVEKYKTTLPFKKLSRDYSLNYSKVKAYGYNTFKRLDLNFVKRLCEVLECSLEEMLVDDKEQYISLRGEIQKKEIKEINKDVQGPVVYFVRNTDGETKIGRTQDLSQRLMSLRYDPRGKGLKLVHYIKSRDINVLEKTLHKVFADKKIQGEWFNLSDEDIAKFK